MLWGLGGENFEWGRGKFVHGEQRLRWIGGGLGCFSRYYNITHISLRGCMHCMYMCTDMVYSKELERDVTTIAMAKALLRLKFLASFLHSTRSVRFFYVRRTHKGFYVHVM